MLEDEILYAKVEGAKSKLEVRLCDAYEHCLVILQTLPQCHDRLYFAVISPRYFCDISAIAVYRTPNPCD